MLTPATQSVSESSGSMEFTVTLSVESCKKVTMDCETLNGTAIADEDYIASSETALRT